LSRSLSAVTEWAATHVEKYLPDIGSASNLPPTGNHTPIIDVTSPTPMKPKPIAPKTPRTPTKRLQPIDTRKPAPQPSSSKTPTNPQTVLQPNPPQQRRFPFQRIKTPTFQEVQWKTPPRLPPQEGAHNNHYNDAGRQRNLPPPQDEDEIPVSPKTPKRIPGTI
jgi:hypothetical protein